MKRETMSNYYTHREYECSVVVYQKYLTRLGELIFFEPWRENYHFSKPSQILFFLCTATLCRYSFYLSTFDLLSFIIFNTDKHEISSIWKWISCSNDVMNRVDCVIKSDIYPQKMHSCSKNIRGISFFVKKISVVYKRKYAMVILHGYSL